MSPCQIDAECNARAGNWSAVGSSGAGEIGSTGTSTGRGIVVFSAGQSLCWNAYKSRYATECARRYPMCGQVLRALRWNRLISRLQQRVLRGIEQAAIAAKQPSWAAVHVRAFVCDQNRREPSFAHVADALRKFGTTGGFVYVVSSVPVAQVQRALPAYTVVGKSCVGGSRSLRLWTWPLPLPLLSPLTL